MSHPLSFFSLPHWEQRVENLECLWNSNRWYEFLVQTDISEIRKAQDQGGLGLVLFLHKLNLKHHSSFTSHKYEYPESFSILHYKITNTHEFLRSNFACLPFLSWSLQSHICHIILLNHVSCCTTSLFYHTLITFRVKFQVHSLAFKNLFDKAFLYH